VPEKTGKMMNEIPPIPPGVFPSPPNEGNDHKEDGSSHLGRFVLPLLPVVLFVLSVLPVTPLSLRVWCGVVLLILFAYYQWSRPLP
jgi:hypothetical protein